MKPSLNTHNFLINLDLLHLSRLMLRTAILLCHEADKPTLRQRLKTAWQACLAAVAHPAANTTESYFGTPSITTTESELTA